MNPLFFEDPGALRAWLRGNHATLAEAWVGLHKKGTGKPSITWPQLVDQLLCFGWIDGVRRSLGAESYAIRVTPRKPGSAWSEVNLRRARELGRAGEMEPPGLAALAAGLERRTRESPLAGEELNARLERYRFELQERGRAWEFFSAQPPSYRRVALEWVASAKREETRRRRLEALIRDSEGGLRIAPLRR